MRTIEFRAWNKKEKKMYYLTEGSAFGIDYEVGIWKNGWELCSISANGKFVVCGQQEAMGNAQMPRDDGELMQFTGLKDKNGEEIYEGDILKHDLWGLTQIIWEHGMFRGKNDKTEYDVTLADHQLQRSRVVGNIYENPDLLKGSSL